MMISACTRPGGLFTVVASFGERLKLEREKRGMTLEEVSGVTKISVRNLRALEQEKFDQMPGGIFNRGFVRSYAKHLGLDEDQVVADYMDAAGETVPQIDQPDAGAVPAETAPDGSPQVPWTALVVLLVLGTVLLAVWSYRSRHRAPEGEAATPAASSPEVPAARGAGAGVQNPSQSLTPPEAASLAPKDVPRDTLSAGSLQAKPPSDNLPVPAASRISSKSNAPPAAPGSGFSLSLRARDEVWLLTTVDGQPPSESIMEDGQSVNVHAVNRVTLKVGNVAGLEFALNGRRVPVTGSQGEVRTMTFTPAGLQASAPSPN